jgi:hypothetical protein
MKEGTEEVVKEVREARVLETDPSPIHKQRQE